MKNLKKFNEFLNESSHYPKIQEAPIRDDNYNYLMNITEKTTYETTSHFFVKDLIEIGTIGNHKLFLNYLDKNSYDEKIAFWFVYNEQPDKLHGTQWESGVIWEEDGYLVHTEKHNLDIKLFPDFIEIIANEIETYSDLDKWIEYIINVGTTMRKYHRWAIQKSGGKNVKPLTWEERIEWVQTNIDSDKLLNRYSKPYEQKELDEMLELGQEEYDKVTDERN